ncbi:MAG: hypothetical protein JXL81_10790 [Deltaproteobacteria bacterium]|nr:hypothetical protein [Deltaproteobacteria bacterium]
MKRMVMFAVIGMIFFAGVLSAGAQAKKASCTREELKGFIDKYFASISAHDIKGLPLAQNVKFTENGVEMPAGTGFWKTAGKVLLRRDLIDTLKCGTHSFAVIEEKYDPAIVGEGQGMALPGVKPKPRPEKGTPRPILFGVRLKVENQMISEIETIIARENEFAFNAEGLLETKDQDWESILKPEERSSRLAMIAAADDYFDMFAADPVVNSPFAEVCDRWENGTQTTKSGMFTLAGEDGKKAEMHAHNCTPKGLVISNHGKRRFLVDTEAGVVVAFVHFASGLPDFHVFKMKNGEVVLINAVIGAGSQSMGWPDEPVCKE